MDQMFRKAHSSLFITLGDSTDPDLNNETFNCFRLGYHGPGNAMRAVRKNGEILSGCFMVGVKRAVHKPFSRWIHLDPPSHMLLRTSNRFHPRQAVIWYLYKAGFLCSNVQKINKGGADKAPQQSQSGLSFTRSWVVPGGITGGSVSSGNVVAPSPWLAEDDDPACIHCISCCT
ncbi:hypothetical protein JOM56_008015 [Amanita muscaria]